MYKNKTFKIIDSFLKLIMIVFIIIYIVNYIETKQYGRLFSCVSLFLVIYLPNIFKKVIRLDDVYLLIYTIFIFLAQFLGSVINLYKYISWYDLFLHFLSGILTYILGIYILEKITNTTISNKVNQFIYLIGFVSMIALSWEIIEYVGDLLFSMNSQHNLETGVHDTMQDVIIALFGGIITHILVSINNKKLLKNDS